MISTSSKDIRYESNIEQTFSHIGTHKSNEINYAKTINPADIVKRSGAFSRTSDDSIKTRFRQDSEEWLKEVQEKNDETESGYSLSSSEQTESRAGTSESVHGKFDSKPGAASSSHVKNQIERVNVYVRKNSKHPYKKADFSICLFDYFDLETPSDQLSMSFVNDRLYLEPVKKRKRSRNSKRSFFHIEHPSFCAVHKMSQQQRDELPKEIAHRGVDVGVSVILESLDEQILVTRRAPHMRTFPGVWVPPGGHIEFGESLQDAGLRELFEETGVKLDASNIVESETLGLWESVFPAVLYEGSPKRHHIVIYILVKIDILAAILQEKLELEPMEVDASVWLSKDLISIVVHGGFDKRFFSDNADVSRVIPITLLTPDGGQEVGALDPNVLKRKMPAKDKFVERISTGTRFALKLWLLRKNKMTDQNVPQRPHSM